MNRKTFGIKEKKAGLILLSNLFMIMLLLGSCSRTISYDNFAGFAQGTTYSMVFENDGSLNPEEIRSKWKRYCTTLTCHFHCMSIHQFCRGLTETRMSSLTLTLPKLMKSQ